VSCTVIVRYSAGGGGGAKTAGPEMEDQCRTKMSRVENAGPENAGTPRNPTASRLERRQLLRMFRRVP